MTHVNIFYLNKSQRSKYYFFRAELELRRFLFGSLHLGHNASSRIFRTFHKDMCKVSFLTLQTHWVHERIDELSFRHCCC